MISQSDGVALKDHLEAQIVAVVRYFEARIRAMEKAVAVAYAAMDKRLDGMNEFRATLKDQTSTMITRQELTAILSGICADVEELKRFRYNAEGKASQKDVNIAMLFGILGLAISVVSLLLRIFGQ